MNMEGEALWTEREKGFWIFLTREVGEKYREKKRDVRAKEKRGRKLA